MILVKNRLFLDKMGLEITLDDHWGRKQAHLDWKIWILQSRHTEIFSKGVTQDFVWKLEISS